MFDSRRLLWWQPLESQEHPDRVTDKQTTFMWLSYSASNQANWPPGLNCGINQPLTMTCLYYCVFSPIPTCWCLAWMSNSRTAKIIKPPSATTLWLFGPNGATYCFFQPPWRVLFYRDVVWFWKNPSSWMWSTSNPHPFQGSSPTGNHASWDLGLQSSSSWVWIKIWLLGKGTTDFVYSNLLQFGK